MNSPTTRTVREFWDLARPWAVGALLGLTACASTPRGHWPQLQDDKSSIVVAAGRFTGVHPLDETPCLLSQEEIESGVVDCWSGTPSTTQFDVFRILYGTLPGRRVQVAYSPSLHKLTLPPGGGDPTLAVLLSDGKHHILSRLTTHIARTASGQWALAVENNESLHVLPCGAKSLIRPLKFETPQSRTLDEFELTDKNRMESLRNNPNIALRGKDLYITRGILLDDIRSLMQPLALTPDTYHCDDYDREEY